MIIAVVVLGLDQGSKAWARTLPAGAPQPVVACCWDWELAANPGVAFSTFAGAGARWLLSLVGLAAAAALVVVARRTAAARRWRLAALGLLLGGAVGNLVDRVRLGAVTDFVRWRIGAHRWPIFNLADVALVVGVAILVIDGARRERAGRFLASGPART